MKKLPPLNALRAFDAAGRHLNFRRAADELYVTQGAVAQHVRALEKQLGLMLFERQPKGLALTQMGREYHGQVASAFDALRDATEQLNPTPAKVVISVTPTFAAKWLIPHLPGFAEKHPEIDLRVLATEQVSSFYADGIDLAVRQAAPPFGASLKAWQLFPNEIVAVATPELAQKVALSQMHKLHDTHDLWPTFAAAIKLQGTIGRGMRFSQTALAIDAAASGQGVALTSRFLVAADLEAGRLVQASEYVHYDPIDFYLLAKRDRRSNPQVDIVVDWIREEAKRRT